MKRRIEQLLNGRFEYVVPDLAFSQERIQIETREGENYRGELYFGAADNRRIKGMVMSSHRRLLLAKDKFAGTTICIPYGIDVKGLVSGDYLETNLTVNSNLGEYQIPVTVRIMDAQIHTSQGEIRTLEEFVSLAQKDYREAFRLYTSERFPEILQGEYRKYRSLYRGMTRNPVTYQHMEEFLIGTGMKAPVKIQLDKREKDWGRIENTLKDTLYLNKNTWGYCQMDVEVRGDFLEVEKKVITSEDFIGSVYGLEYLIRRERLGKGKRYGEIRIRTVYGTLVYQVTASGNTSYEIGTRIYERRSLVKLAKWYESCRLGEMALPEWQDRCLAELEDLKSLGCYGARQQLMEAWIQWKSGDPAAAMSLLWPMREMVFTPEQMEEEAVYLALAVKTGAATDEQLEQGADRVATLHQMMPQSQMILKALLLLSEEQQVTASKKLYLMDELYQFGCTSPFLYLDAYELLAKEENQLKRLTPFMVQVLTYAARKGKLTQELALRIGHLSEYVKTYKNSIYQLLVSCYEAWPGTMLVDDLCKYVMKGEPGRKEYFRWYALAVEADIRITRLYEYFIETMPENYQQVLPQVIRMYFVYNNTLSSRKKASVYANVIRNKTEDKATYHSYKKAMEEFALEALEEGRIGENYAVIYQECLDKIRDAKVGKALCHALFSYRVYCDDPKIRQVIVCHGELEEESSYPCSEGAAYVQLYTQDAQILFEDDKKRRYAATVDHNLQQLMADKNYVEQCVKLGVKDPGFLLHICSREYQNGEIHGDTLGCYQYAAGCEAFREEFRQEICRKLLKYYGEHVEDSTLDLYLRQMDYMTFAKVDKVLLTELLIEKGMYSMAYEVISVYGYEGIRLESLVKLASRMILQSDFVEREELVYLALHVFKEGVYDDVILTYLSDNLLGSVEEMALLWERMKGFQLDTYGLEEELLLLAMYGRVPLKQGAKILTSYIQQKGKRQIILAYLSFRAYGYFLGDEETQDEILEYLQTCYERGYEMDQICRLALLKYYTKKPSICEEEDRVIREILKECSEAGLRFAFFQKLPGCYTKPYQLDDKQFVEVRYPADAKVTIHYYLGEGEPGEDGYKSESMRHMYQGIFVKEFLLFYGEKLQYYLTIERDGNSEDTEVRTLVPEDLPEEQTSRYQLINQMLAGQKLGQDERTEKAIEQYLKREQLSGQLFSLMV